MKIKFKNKKYIFFSLLFLLFCNFAIAETTDNLTEKESEEKSEVLESSPSEDVKTEKTKKTFLERTDFVLQFDPTLYLSPDSKKNNSNVVNILYPITIGGIWPNDYFISFQPSLSFFIMEHLWFDKFALPAEIENRTSTTLSFMINLPAVYTFTFKRQSKLQLSAGIGIFLRFGILSNGVKEGDPGYSGSAGSDLKLINNWFWENAHWLYLTFGTSWLYPITSKIKVGPTVNAYIPMGTLIDQQNVQGLMLTFGIKLCR